MNLTNIYTREHADAFKERVFGILKARHYWESDDDLKIEAQIIATAHLDDISSMLDRLYNRIIEEEI